ncbi:hypothetical protein WMF30_10820 [Sorangium sp. So ce134]
MDAQRDYVDTSAIDLAWDERETERSGVRPRPLPITRAGRARRLVELRQEMAPLLAEDRALREALADEMDAGEVEEVGDCVVRMLPTDLGADGKVKRKHSVRVERRRR